MFQSLADSLDKTFRNLRGVGKISESNITDALREIRLALLEADVEFSVARDFINRIKDKAVGVEVLKSIKPGEQIVKIFHDERSISIPPRASCSAVSTVPVKPPQLRNLPID
jgi:signal recognition particle subunit SRP54